MVCLVISQQAGVGQASRYLMLHVVLRNSEVLCFVVSKSLKYGYLLPLCRLGNLSLCVGRH